MKQIDLLLASIYRLTNGQIKNVSFERVIVNAFKSYPEVFRLKGYPDYPDSAQIEKRIYDSLKPSGVVRVANRKLTLTEYGLDIAKSIVTKLQGKTERNKVNDFTKSESKLWQKLTCLDGFKLYLKDRETEPLDIDVYDFYGISVRTNRAEAMGRIKRVNALLAKATRLSSPGIQEIKKYKLRIDRLLKEIRVDANQTDRNSY